MSKKSIERKKLGKRWRRLVDKYDSSEGAQIIRGLQHLTTSHHIVKGNYQDLKRLITTVESDIMIMADKNRKQFDVALKEITRMLHNYLASVHSLIDHSRRYRRKLNNDTLNQNNEREINKLTRNKCVIFVKKFRNYIQHYSLPIIAGHVHLWRKDVDEPDFEEDFKILLNKEELLKWDGWNKISKDFIENHEELVLRTIFDEYERMNNIYYEWFYNEVIKTHKDKIEELRKLENEIDNVNKKIEKLKKNPD